MSLKKQFIDRKTGQFALGKDDLKNWYTNYASDLGNEYKWDSSWDNMTPQQLWGTAKGYTKMLII